MPTTQTGVLVLLVRRPGKDRELAHQLIRTQACPFHAQSVFTHTTPELISLGNDSNTDRQKSAPASLRRDARVPKRNQLARPVFRRARHLQAIE